MKNILTSVLVSLFLTSTAIAGKPVMKDHISLCSITSVSSDVYVAMISPSSDCPDANTTPPVRNWNCPIEAPVGYCWQLDSLCVTLADLAYAAEMQACMNTWCLEQEKIGKDLFACLSGCNGDTACDDDCMTTAYNQSAAAGNAKAACEATVALWYLNLDCCVLVPCGQ